MEKTCKFVKSLRMVRGKHDKPSEKAIRSRIYRKKQWEQRRFEGPLREFIEIRYKVAFAEYKELYKLMDAQNPKKNDLRKCKLFKQWKIENQEESSDILTTAIRETIGETSEAGQSETSEAEQAETSEAEKSESREGEHVETSEAEQAETSEAEHGETSEAGQSETSESERDYTEEIMNEGYAEETMNEGLLAAQHLDQLVNELNREDELRDLMNIEDPNDDEGIELNVFDELDVEPFDYHLEVELGLW